MFAMLLAGLLVQDAAAHQDQEICILGNADRMERMLVLRDEIEGMAVELEKLEKVRKTAQRSADRAQADLNAFSADRAYSAGKVSSAEENFSGTFRGTEQGAAIQSSREHERSTVLAMNEIIELRKTKVLEFRALEREPQTQTECHAQD